MTHVGLKRKAVPQGARRREIQIVRWIKDGFGLVSRGIFKDPSDHKEQAWCSKYNKRSRYSHPAPSGHKVMNWRCYRHLAEPDRSTQFQMAQAWTAKISGLT